MAKTKEDVQQLNEAIEERQKCLKIIEKKVKGGIIKSTILLENINVTTGAALTFVRHGENKIEIPTTMVLGILKSLADPNNQVVLNRMLKAQCDGHTYSLDLAQNGRKISSKDPKPPSDRG